MASGLASAGLARRECARSEPSIAHDIARLRRQSTRHSSYAAGQQVTIVRCPQRLAGVIDVGHISVLVRNHDGTLASLGFYSRNYRAGLANTMVVSDAGVLLSPDPLYVKARRDPALRQLITPLYSGALSEAQAARLNEWTDDQANVLELTTVTTSAGEAQERAIAHIDGERYVGATVLLSGENCATFVEKFFPGAIKCSMGLPRWCRGVAGAAGASGEDNKVR